jgi:hypothetical protein
MHECQPKPLTGQMLRPVWQLTQGDSVLKIFLYCEISGKCHSTTNDTVGEIQRNYKITSLDQTTKNKDKINGFQNIELFTRLVD